MSNIVFRSYLMYLAATVIPQKGELAMFPQNIQGFG